jgi:hypothetical protein
MRLPGKIKSWPVFLIRCGIDYNNGIGCNNKVDCNKQMQKSNRKEKTGAETTLL